MSGKNSKKIRRQARLEAEAKTMELLTEAFQEIRRWPFKERFTFAWRIVFPKRQKAKK